MERCAPSGVHRVHISSLEKNEFYQIAVFWPLAVKYDSTQHRHPCVGDWLVDWEAVIEKLLYFGLVACFDTVNELETVHFESAGVVL